MSVFRNFIFFYIFLFYSSSKLLVQSENTNNVEHKDHFAAAPMKEGVGQQKVDKIQMMRHSWDAPLSLDNTLSEWDLAMATIPVRKSVVLVPAVPLRTGQLWNKAPVKTPSFEVIFTFDVAGPSPPVAEGFAFWYVEEPYSSVFPRSNDELQQWNLLGYKNNPKGIGVLFSATDRTMKPNPSISLLISDGSKAVKYANEVPTSQGVYFDYRNSKEPLTFRLVVNNQGITGQIKTTPTSKWIDCFNSKHEVKAGGYIGFTAYTGDEQKSKISDKVSFYSLHMYNLDLHFVGEDAGVLHESLGSVDVSDILKDVNVKNEADLVEALRQLTRMLYKHISEASPREQMIHKTMVNIFTQVQSLTTELKELQKELRFATGVNHTDVMHHMKSELVGLKTMFQKHSTHQANTLSVLHTKLSGEAPSDFHKAFSEKTAKLEETIKNSGNRNIWLSLILILIVGCFGFLVWKKMKDMEKKHFL